MSMPEQKPGLSKQNYQTPFDFIHATKRKLNVLDFAYDLAADSENTQAVRWFDEAHDSLKQDWAAVCYKDYAKHDNWLWLNPPYANIREWVVKAHDESLKGAKIAMLIPASVGANWWAEYVEKSCYQLFLNGRITFVGCTTPYPKDTALLLYTPYIRSGNAVWDWRT